MKYAITDIGTNTIRSVIYDVDKKITIDKDLTFPSEILKYTKNSVLIEEGIKKLCSVLLEAKEFYNKNGIYEINCIATSAMREAENFEEVKAFIKEKTTITIRLLSEEEEAMFDYMALVGSVGEDESGTGIDLGGGSMQIIEFYKGKKKRAVSYKVGVKRLYNKFGVYNHPDNSEIITYLKDILKNEKSKTDTLYVMGGTTKLIFRLYELNKTKKSDNFEVRELENIKEGFKKADARLILCAGNRIDNVLYGLDVVKTMCEITGAKRIKLIKAGVREGYIRAQMNL